MKQMGIIITTICLCLAFCACGQGTLPKRSPAPTVMNDRQDVIDNVGNENSSLESNSDINKLIESYNKVVDNDKKIQNYTLMKEDGSYIIISNNKDTLSKYRVRLDDDGSPLTLTMLSGSADEKVACATAVMQVMWNKEFVPKDAKECIEAIHADIDELADVIEEFRNNYEKYELDTDMPTYDELKTQFNTLKKEFENLQKELLEE